jgi:hypothetical protein
MRFVLHYRGSLRSNGSGSQARTKRVLSHSAEEALATAATERAFQLSKLSPAERR